MKRLLCLLGCALAAPAQPADPPALTVHERETARRLYVAKCAKCHRFYEPRDYPEADWRRWMESMNRKSRFKPEQSEVLIRYLDAYRAGQLPGKPEARVKTR